jgi:4,4'-diaponeurosporenoate glycosyltransferase
VPFELASDVIRWSLAVWLVWRIPRVPRASIALAARVSVVIPARDEATSLPSLLGSLARAAVEVIVVDDHSTDGTAGVAAEGGAQVITAPPLEPGWTGKTAACAAGARAATGDVLVFVDADVAFCPGGAERVAALVTSQGGLVSVQPHHDMRRPYERLSLFFNLVGMMAVDAFGPFRTRWPPSGAFGPVMACSRADYEASGGHASVRAEVVEDVALAQRFRQAGRPVDLRGGKGTATFRMYPRGVGQLAEGWTKNIASGAAVTRIVTLLLVVAWLSGCIQAIWRLPHEPLLYGAFVLQLWWLGHRIGRYGPVTAVLYPIPLAFFLALFVWSAVRTRISGQVRWKGRTVPVTR